MRPNPIMPSCHVFLAVVILSV